MHVGAFEGQGFGGAHVPALLHDQGPGGVRAFDAPVGLKPFCNSHGRNPRGRTTFLAGATSGPARQGLLGPVQEPGRFAGKSLAKHVAPDRIACVSDALAGTEAVLDERLQRAVEGASHGVGREAE